MSLQAQKYIIRAIGDSAEMRRTVKNRVFYAGRDAVAEEEDKVPYIVVEFVDSNEVGTKDGIIGETSHVEALCVAESGEKLIDLCEGVKEAVENGARSDRRWPYVVSEVSCTAGAVEFDPQKPCFYQRLSFEVETIKK